jgi:hypothetical protein
MPINITPDGNGFKIEPKHSTTSPGTEVSFSVGVQGGVRICFSDANIWNPSASYFDLPQGSTSKMTSTTPQCTGFGTTTSGSNCPSVSGCSAQDDPPTISTSSPIAGSKHGHPHHGRK